MTVCLCMTACCLSFFFFPWPVFSLLFSASFSFSFSPPLSSKTIKVRIIDDEEYEKNKSFFLEIGEPQLAETNEKKGGGRGLSLRRKSHIQHTHRHTHTEHQSTWNLLCSGSSSGSTTGQTTPSTALRPAPRVCLLVCVCVCVCVYHACIIPTPLLLSCFCRKTISVRVLNREEYDKQCSFCIELQTPLWRRRGWTVYRGFSPSHSVSFAFYSSLPLGRVSPSFSLSLLVSCAVLLIE